MSFWKKLGKLVYPLEKPIDKAYHSITGAPTSKQIRAQNNAINEQIQAYKDQTEITRQQVDKLKNEENNEKRRVEEKQIRSLRRNYRVQSFLGNQDSGEPDMTSKLGG